MHATRSPRRRLWVVIAGVLLVAAAAVVWLVASGSKHPPSRPRPAVGGVQSFASRPDLRPTAITLTKPARGTAPGYVFISPKGGKAQFGPMIVDDRGRLVWFRPMRPGTNANDFRVQRYRGRPVLTWWEGRTNTKGWGQGSYVIADRAYHVIARVKAGNGLRGDLHEFVLTDRGTALITVYHRVPADLSAVGSSRRGELVDSVVQEIDVATGKVRFQWRSRDHVGLKESYAGPPRKHVFAYDYFHVNSVTVDTDGNLLVSARNTWAVYKLDRRTGEVLWRLGGKRSDFDMGKGTRFAWQHDAQRQDDGTITLFDNSATPKVAEQSRAIALDVDTRRRTARLVRSYEHPDRLLAIAEGNSQALPGDRTFVGYGMARHVSEYAPDGRLLFDLQLPGKADSYRAYRFRWSGQPSGRPAVAAERREDGRLTVAASWNGATAVTGWKVLAGPDPSALAEVGSGPRTGFETTLDVEAEGPYVAVRAMAGDRPLRTSPPVRAR